MFIQCILMNEPFNFSLVEHSVTRIQAILTNMSYLSYVKFIELISEQYLAIYVVSTNLQTINHLGAR